ncbi:MAG: HNH endonuclease, partial [Gemmatimonadales bacterium]|nr:HNH endonuclease [Gemmatimonadales bacterium]
DVLGNLTLVNTGLNSSISNGPWSEKKAAIAKSSTLLINKDVTDSEVWDETAIAQRGEELLDIITDIWSRPRD